MRQSTRTRKKYPGTKESRFKGQVMWQRHLDRILDSLPHPFYVINAKDYSIVVANRAALEGQGKGGQHTCYGLTHYQSNPCCRHKEPPCPLETVMKTKKPTLVEHSYYDGKEEQRFVEVLKRVARRLKAVLRHSDTVACLGGGGYRFYGGRTPAIFA